MEGWKNRIGRMEDWKKTMRFFTPYLSPFQSVPFHPFIYWLKWERDFPPTVRGFLTHGLGDFEFTGRG
jgi:hypothetical protein